jgi:hypothetical protein
MSRVGIDLDGVCYDFNESLEIWCKHREMKLNYGPSTRWEFYEDWGLSLEEFLTECEMAADGGWLFRYGKVINDAKDQLQRLRDAGHTIVLITDRSFGHFGGKGNSSRVNTEQWLKQVELPYDEIHFTADKSSVQVDYHLDDKPGNYEAMKAVGVDAWLLNCPWNADYTSPSGEYLYRANGMAHFVDWVLFNAQKAGSFPVPNGHVSTIAKPPMVVDGGIAAAVFVPDREVREIVVETQACGGFGGEVRTTASSGGQKGVKLARFDLLPTGPLWSLAELYGKGAEKYADRNWEKGYEWSKSYAAAQRHMNLFWSGEYFDKHEETCPPDCNTHTGLPHLACAVFHMFALQEWHDTHPEFDDRAKK